MRVVTGMLALAALLETERVAPATRGTPQGVEELKVESVKRKTKVESVKRWLTKTR